MDRNKKGQSFYWDFIAGTVLFMAVIILFIRYDTVIFSGDDDISSVVQDGKIISETLMTAGYPENWSADNAASIGITDGNGRVDNLKLQSFYNITAHKYDNSKIVFGVKSDYSIIFIDNEESIMPVKTHNGTAYYIGKPGIDPVNIRSRKDVSAISKIDRHLILDSKIVKMRVISWKTEEE